MPVKRRLPKGRAHRITDQVVQAWRIGDYLALHRLLGIYPHQVSPFDVDGPDPPSWAKPGDNYHTSWPLAWQLRQELVKHCPPGRVGRHGEPLGPA